MRGSRSTAPSSTIARSISSCSRCSTGCDSAPAGGGMGLHAGIAHLDGSPISNDDREWLRAIPRANVLSDALDTGFGLAWTDPPGSFRTNVAKAAAGAVVLWNGRLDNRLELTARFREEAEPRITEADLAAAAVERYGDL